MSNTLYALLTLSAKTKEFYLSFHLTFTSAFNNLVIMPDENLCKEKSYVAKSHPSFTRKKIV